MVEKKLDQICVLTTPNRGLSIQPFSVLKPHYSHELHLAYQSAKVSVVPLVCMVVSMFPHAVAGQCFTVDMRLNLKLVNFVVTSL